MAYKLEIYLAGSKNNTATIAVTDGIFQDHRIEYEASIFDPTFKSILADYEALVKRIRDLM